MLRRLTAALGMLALIGVLSVLIWEVYHHHRHPLERASNFVQSSRLIA